MRPIIYSLIFVLGCSFLGNSQQNSSFLINHEGDAISSVDFSDIEEVDEHPAWPNCYEPTNFRAIGYGASNNSVHVTWDDLNPSENDVKYVIRYRQDGNMFRGWEEKVVKSKNYSILSDLRKDAQYSIQIKRVCDGLNTEEEIASGWVEINVSLVDLREDYPPCPEEICDCWELMGEDATYEEIINSDCFKSEGDKSDCNITSVVIEDVVINNNGTENNLDDDFITFELTPEGDYLLGGYTLNSKEISIEPPGAEFGSSNSFKIKTNGTEDNYYVTISSKKNSDCSFDFVINHPGYEADSSNNQVCEIYQSGLGVVVLNDNSTTYPDDDYLTFSLKPTGIETGTNYTVVCENASIDSPSNGQFGETSSFTIHTHGKEQGYKIKIISDEGCYFTEWINNPLHENSCGLTSSGISGVSLNKNGTEDTTDDFLKFYLNPKGDNTGSTYSVTIDHGDISPTNATFGNRTFFTIPTGGSEENYTIHITSNDEDNCSFTQIINKPNYTNFIENNGSSGLKTLCAQFIHCTPIVIRHNNSTPEDKLDDYLVFTLNPKNRNTSNSSDVYDVSVNEGTIFPEASYYGKPTEFRLGTGSAKDGNKFIVTIINRENPDCSYDIVINDPGTKKTIGTIQTIQNGNYNNSFPIAFEKGSTYGISRSKYPSWTKYEDKNGISLCIDLTEIGKKFIDNEYNFNNNDVAFFEIRYNSPMGKGTQSLFIDVNESIGCLEFPTGTDLSKFRSSLRPAYMGNPQGLVNNSSTEVAFLDKLQQFSREDEICLCGDIQIVINEDEGREKDDLPDLECGKSYDPIGNTTPLQNAEQGDIFYINRLPIVLSNVNGSNGTFSGKGILVLPFAELISGDKTGENKAVLVQFNNVSVSTTDEGTMHILSGTINAISDNPSNYKIPDGTLVIGSKSFCTDPAGAVGWGEDGLWYPGGTSYDPNGFDEGGNYKKPPFEGWNEGDPFNENYDPNGFDKDGNYISGSKYNECGCSQKGLTEDGTPCDPADCNGHGPYFWEGGEEHTSEGIALANEVRESIESWILASLQIQDSTNTEEREKLRGDASATLFTMDEKIKLLDYDHKMIYGENNEYRNEGLSKRFMSQPTILNDDIGRSEDTKLIEQKHVELYSLDKEILKIGDILKIIKMEENPGQLDIWVDEIDELIKSIPANQIKDLKENNYKLLKVWVHERMIEKVNIKYTEDFGIGFIENNYDNFIKRHKNKGFNKTDYGSFVSTDDIQITESFKENLDFKFHQGWTKINGVHRAFYLEQMERGRRLGLYTSTPPGDPGSLLPVVLNTEIKNRDYKIYIDNINIVAGEDASLDAYMVMEDPKTGDKFAMEGKNIHFTASGLTEDISSRLKLDTDIEYVVNNNLLFRLKGTNDTYVEWGCQGFKKMGIDAEFEVCRNYLIPLNPTTMEVSNNPEERVKLEFKGKIDSWADFTVDVDVSNPFIVAKAPNFKWTAKNIKFDYSQISNPDGDFLPPNYEIVDNPVEHWQGLYIGELSANIKQIKKNNADITIGVEKAIFDRMGFSGNIYADYEVISLDQGNLGGWAFSLSNFNARFKYNHLEGAGFGGLIHVPIVKNSSSNNIKPQDCIKYDATIYPNEKYAFTLQPRSNKYKIPIWIGEIKLDGNSSVNVVYENDEFKSYAKLNGSIDIDGELGGSILKVDNIDFQDVVISSVKPYFAKGTWSVGGASINYKGFGLTFDNIGLNDTEQEGEIDLAFRALIHLTGKTKNGDTEDKLGITAGGGFHLIGKKHEISGRQIWKYKDSYISSLLVNATFKQNHIHGELNFFKNDPTYGSGFRGLINVSFASFKKTGGMAAVAVFGSAGSEPEEKYKYFFVDAMVKLPKGIPLVPGLQASGFGGGIYYHMARPSNSNINLNNASETPQLPSSIGQSLSGVSYVPNKKAWLGLKANVLIATEISEKTFNGIVSFGIAFNKDEEGVGFKEISLTGRAALMKEPSFVAQDYYNSKVNANVDIRYDFQNKELAGKIDVNMNVANGALKGNGKALIYFGEKDWYINVGAPKLANGKYYKIGAEALPPISLKIGIPEVANIGTAEAYLDIGTKIPPFPPLPDKVKNITNLVTPNESMRGTGRGFAFGAKLDFATPKLRYAIFYAQFAAGVGFDFMLQDYGDVYCYDQSEPLGINGWYASGQMWAYMTGNIGVEVDTWLYSGKYNIIDLSAAAVLQARLPNPTWISGTVGGKYNILGGLVKGHCTFNFELGESCQVVGADNTVEDYEVIFDVSPPNETTGVPTNIEPVTTFAVPLGESFELSGVNSTVDYETKFDYAHMVYYTDEDESVVINGYKEWNDNKTVMTFVPYTMLPPNEELFFEVSVKKYINGQEADNSPEVKRIKLLTTKTFTTIPESNIDYSYPLQGMANYYKDMGHNSTNKVNFIKLKKGQPSLFENKAAFIRVTPSGGGTPFEVPLEYESFENKIEFELPTNLMELNTIYKLQVIKDVEATAYNGLWDGNTIEKVLYTMYFRSSSYPTFRAKMEYFVLNATHTYTNNDVLISSAELTDHEGFDRYELIGDGEIDPLISYRGHIRHSTWYKKDEINPQKMYNYFSGQNIFGFNIYNDPDYVSYRDISLGSPPEKAVFTKTTKVPDLVNESNFESGNYIFDKGKLKISNEIFKNIYIDKYELNKFLDLFFHHVRNFNCGGGTNAQNQRKEPKVDIRSLPFNLCDFRDTDFGKPDNGEYKISIYYKLPEDSTPPVQFEFKQKKN